MIVPEKQSICSEPNSKITALEELFQSLFKKLILAFKNQQNQSAAQSAKTNTT